MTEFTDEMRSLNGNNFCVIGPVAPKPNAGLAKVHTIKARIDLIPAQLVFAAGRALAFGDAKHGGRHPAENQASADEHFAALQRHLWAWQSGKDRDGESGLSHLDHAAARMAMLIAAASDER